MVGLFTASCQKDELLYSCDHEIDQWTKDNYKNIQNFTVVEFLNLDYGKQKAAYIAMEEGQRHGLWIAKLNEILQMGWTQEEAEHIESLVSFIGKNKSLFSNAETQQNSDLFELFMYSWMEYAQEVLFWDRETIHSICGDPNKAVQIMTRSGIMKLSVPKVSEYVTSMQPLAIKTRSEGGGEGGGKGGGGESWYPDCGCSQKNDWCDIFKEIPGWVVSCNSAKFKCKIIRKNCGLFWQFDCDGICKSPIA